MEPGAPCGEGKIYNANRFTLMAALRQAGCQPVYLGLAGDSAEAISEVIDRGLNLCDAVPSTGGVSVGDYDLTPDAMERAGVHMLLRGIRMKPGMACAYGEREGKLFCGLSSEFDPLATQQFTEDEMRAAVEAASDYGTYVMAHLYTTGCIQRAVRAGIKSLEHAHVINDESARMIADKGVFVMNGPQFTMKETEWNHMGKWTDYPASRLKPRRPKLVHNQTVGNDSHNQQNGDDLVAVGQEAVPVSDFGLHVFDFAEACML